MEQSNATPNALAAISSLTAIAIERKEIRHRLEKQIAWWQGQLLRVYRETCSEREYWLHLSNAPDTYPMGTWYIGWACALSSGVEPAWHLRVRQRGHDAVILCEYAVVDLNVIAKGHVPLDVLMLVEYHMQQFIEVLLAKEQTSANDSAMLRRYLSTGEDIVYDAEDHKDA